MKEVILRRYVKPVAVGVMLTVLTALGVTVTAAPAYAATYKWVSNYIYSDYDPTMRAWIGARIATSDDGRVNDVIYCKFVMQHNFGGTAGWQNYIWNDNGYVVWEYDHTASINRFITSANGPSSSAAVQVAADTYGNIPSWHGVGCTIHIYGGAHGVARGSVWDGST
jgi:hypothetical protein